MASHPKFNGQEIDDITNDIMDGYRVSEHIGEISNVADSVIPLTSVLGHFGGLLKQTKGAVGASASFKVGPISKKKRSIKRDNNEIADIAKDRMEGYRLSKHVGEISNVADSVIPLTSVLGYFGGPLKQTKGVGASGSFKVGPISTKKRSMKRDNNEISKNKKIHKEE